MNTTISNPNSALEIRIETDDPLMFDEMLRDMASTMLTYLANHREGADIRDVYTTALISAIEIAKRRQCSDRDWVSFAGYAGLLAAQATAPQLWDANK